MVKEDKFFILYISPKDSNGLQKTALVNEKFKSVTMDVINPKKPLKNKGEYDKNMSKVNLKTVADFNRTIDYYKQHKYHFNKIKVDDFGQRIVV